MSQQQQQDFANKMALSSSSFSFTSPFPLPSSGPQPGMKQRRVSLALPSSPKVFPAWSFRDDTSIDSHVTSNSPLAPEKKGKTKKAVSEEKPFAQPTAEKRQRKKWTEEETQMLVNGCNIWGVGNWKAILNDPNLKFDSRSPVDLKDRFRTFFPDAYKLHYPNAKTHLSSKVRSTLPDGTCLFEKTRSKKRRPFTPEEDAALRAGYEKYGTVWSTIVKDPIFQEQKRRSTDLRDRFRNAFPHLYQAAGYKPRSIPKKKKLDVPTSPHRTMDDQSIPSRTGPTRRRRSRTNPIHHSYSVPQSVECSEDEDSSDDDDIVEIPKLPPKTMIKETTPQPEDSSFGSDTSLSDMNAVDPLADIPLPDFFPETSQSLSDSPDQSQTWSSEQNSPPNYDAWSSAPTTTASPTSSQISTADYFMRDLAFSFNRRADGVPMVGKSGWGPTEWLSANPRMDPSAGSGSGSFIGGPSPPPSSPFSFSHLSHGIMDRYDLFQSPLSHDFASELGPSDSLSTFSDPDLFPTQSMRGFTHHSNYAGDLIFGARTHQPLGNMNIFSGLGQGSMGLGLTGVAQPAPSVNPMQLHTPSLPGIDELELTGIRLDDNEDEVMASTSDSIEGKDVKPPMSFDDDISAFIGLPPQTLEEIVGLTMSPRLDQMEAEMVTTPPATPAQSVRSTRDLAGPQYASMHNRSMSVPPFEHRTPSRPVLQQGHATPQPAPTRSLSSLFDVPGLPSSASSDSDTSSSLNGSGNNNNVLSSSLLFSDHFKTSGDFSDLLFLDLHFHGSGLVGGTGGGGGGLSTLQHHDIIDSDVDEIRRGQALDLAHTTAMPLLNGLQSSPAAGSTGISPQSITVTQSGTIRGSSSSHHRGQSAISPKDLFSQIGSENKRKRASWDGGLG